MQTLEKVNKIEGMDNKKMIAANGEVKVSDLARWLQEQLNLRGWTTADLVKRTGLYHSTISRILKGEREAGPDTCLALAKALDEQPDKIFRLAGLLPEENEDSGQMNKIQEEIVSLTGQLDETGQRMVLEIVKGLVSRVKRRP